VWNREVAGLRLTFHLAGINNQNFLMRDEETEPIGSRSAAWRLQDRCEDGS
jgi:hypothetical protein